MTCALPPGWGKANGKPVSAAQSAPKGATASSAGQNEGDSESGSDVSELQETTGDLEEVLKEAQFLKEQGGRLTLQERRERADAVMARLCEKL